MEGKLGSCTFPLPVHTIITVRVFYSQVVELKDMAAIKAYLENVPPSYHHYIRHLTICTSPTRDKFDALCPPTVNNCHDVTRVVSQLLLQCRQIVQLTLNLDGSLHQDVIPCFQTLQQLRVLSINHCGDEQQTPLCVTLCLYLAVLKSLISIL